MRLMGLTYRQRRRAYFIGYAFFSALLVTPMIWVWFTATNAALEQVEPCACECGPCTTLCSPTEQPPTYHKRVSGLEVELKRLAEEQDELVVECVRITQALVTCRTAEALRVKNNK